MSQSTSAQGMVDGAFTQVLGLPVWAPAVGVGSFLTIEFGDARINSVGVPQGEFHLWVFGAGWEILEGMRTLASSSDDHAAMVAGARVLDGSSMQGFVFDRERMTLNLQFDPYELAITPLGDPEMEEWSLYLDDGTVITAGPGEIVTRDSASFSQLLPDDRDDVRRN